MGIILLFLLALKVVDEKANKLKIKDVKVPYVQTAAAKIINIKCRETRFKENSKCNYSSDGFR